MIYDLGDRRKLICEIRDEDDVLADPTTLIFKMIEPDQTYTEYEYGTDEELVKDSTGKYHVYWDCITPGIHYWRYEATGSVVAAEEADFYVRKSKVVT